MKKVMILLIVFFFIGLFKPLTINSQEDEILAGCKASLRSPFIVSERTFKALLTGEEVAEFRATFFSGTVYRLVSCGFESENVQFTVMDTNRNIIFASTNYKNADLWDFQMEGSMECIIEARLKTERVKSGMIFMLLGFRSSNPEAI